MSDPRPPDDPTRQMEIPRPAPATSPPPTAPPAASLPPTAASLPPTAPPAPPPVVPTSRPLPYDPPAAPTVYRRLRHPLLGLIGGLLLGLGVALLLISYALAPLGVATPWVTIVVFAILGLLWGLFAPTRGRRSADVDVQVDTVAVADREGRP